MGDYLDCDMVAKKAYVYSGSINRSVELRKREDFNFSKYCKGYCIFKKSLTRKLRLIFINQKEAKRKEFIKKLSFC